jgi:hypothetical protein
VDEIHWRRVERDDLDRTLEPGLERGLELERELRERRPGGLAVQDREVDVASGSIGAARDASKQ